MAKRKPLPYHASQAVDDARIEATNAVNALAPLLDGEPVSRDELYRRIGKSVYHIQRLIRSLNSIRQET